MNRLRERIRNLPLASKIFGVTSLLVMLTVFALTFVSIQRERANFEKELLQKAELFLETASHGLRDPLYRAQIDEIADLSNQVRDNPNITFFVVYDQEGRVLADSRKPSLPFSQERDALGSAILSSDETLYLKESKTAWETGRKIKLGDQTIGAVSAGFSVEPLNQKIADVAIQGGALAILILLAGTALTTALARQISQPLSALAAIATRMSEGDLSQRATYLSNDEIGQLGKAFNRMAEQLQEREWLRDMFGRFVSRDLADALRGGRIKLEGESRLVSILFCDVREFTAYSEKHTPEEAFSLLNQIFPIIAQAASQYGGMVNKFSGDSALIIFGAPNEVENSAYHAVMTALEIRALTAELNRGFIRKGEPPIRLGVGINSGRALAGAIGPAERQEYMVVGDAVNLAARIDALNKQFPENDVLISKWTYEALGERRKEFKFNSLGKVPVRGRSEPLEIWSVIGKASKQNAA